jgi:hypothetical protein
MLASHFMSSLLNCICNYPVCQEGARDLSRGNPNPGEAQDVVARFAVHCLISARGGAVLDGPEALTEGQAGGQELMV